MNHKQILDKIPAGLLVTALDQEIAKLTFTAMAGHKIGLTIKMNT